MSEFCVGKVDLMLGLEFVMTVAVINKLKKQHFM